MTVSGLPLEDEIVHVEIDRQHASSVVRHIYRNRSGRRLEGTFVWRGGQGTNVAGFAYWNRETKIVGEVFERTVAHQIYDETVHGRRDPGLLEAQGEGTFAFRVFPIEAAERKRVELSLDQWLPRRGGVVEYRVPLARPDAEVDVVITDDRHIVGLTSPSHELKMTGHSKRVRLRAVPRPGRGAAFVLRYQLGDRPLTLASAYHRDRGHDGYVVFHVSAPPSTSGPALPQDVTLVIDRSGSMAGEPLRHARRAATNVVARLRPDDRVNVIVFDDGAHPLYTTPQRVTDSARAQATEFIERTIDGGGTDIARALRTALLSQHDGTRPKTILFLTDGQSDAAQALEVAKRDDRDVRVFTVGLGPQVARPLLSRLASIKRGRFTYIDHADSLERAVADLYRRIAAPVVVDLRLQTDNTRVHRVYPARIPDLFAGDEVRIVARVRGTGPLELALAGRGVAGPVVMPTTVSARAKSTRPWVGKLWAQARVDHLLEEIALAGERPELTDETIELSLAYNLMTPYTAFLAIPESELTASTASTLRQARAQKARVRARHADAVALQATPLAGPGLAGSVDADDAPMLTSDRAMRESAMAPERRSRRFKRSNTSAAGCASCDVGGPTPMQGLWAFLIGVAWARRRRRSL